MSLKKIIINYLIDKLTYYNINLSNKEIKLNNNENQYYLNIDNFCIRVVFDNELIKIKYIHLFFNYNLPYIGIENNEIYLYLNFNECEKIKLNNPLSSKEINFLKRLDVESKEIVDSIINILNLFKNINNAKNDIIVNIDTIINILKPDLSNKKEIKEFNIDKLSDDKLIEILARKIAKRFGLVEYNTGVSLVYHYSLIDKILDDPSRMNTFLPPLINESIIYVSSIYNIKINEIFIEFIKNCWLFIINKEIVMDYDFQNDEMNDYFNNYNLDSFYNYLNKNKHYHSKLINRNLL